MPAGNPTQPKANASRRRREREREQMRERLLDAARLIAAEEGWQAVTIRRLADRLEYTSPILYQHFSGKDALLVELVAIGFAEVAALLTEAAQAPARSRLAALAEAYWRFAFTSPELYQAMNSLGGVPFGTADTPPAAREAFGVLRTALQEIADDRGTGLADADDAADTVWAYLHGFVALTMGGRIAGGPDRSRALMLAGLDGLFATQLRAATG